VGSTVQGRSPAGKKKGGVKGENRQHTNQKTTRCTDQPVKKGVRSIKKEETSKEKKKKAK